MDKMSIGIIMPSLNEQRNVADAVTNTLKAFDDFDIDGEVIVINDGSTDRTGEIVEKLREQDPRVRMLTHDSPQGIGASFWDGVDHSKATFVCMLPGDNENDPWEIMRYFHLLNHVDMVIPFVFNKGRRSPLRNALSFTFRLVINMTFLVNLNYTNGTVMYRKSILQQLDYRSRGFFFQTDILIRTTRNGYLYAEVPYSLGIRKGGVSKALTLPSLIQVAKGYGRLIKDVYTGKKPKNGRRFAEDSLTAQRWSTNDNLPEVERHE